MNASDNDWPDDLPVLTEIVADQPTDDLPILTEVISLAADEPVQQGVTAQELQEVLHQLEIHLDTVVAEKLRLHLDQIQAQAVAQTLSELKAGLPVLLQEALNARRKSG
ncbi:MAG TPA: hypothetical protein VFK88_00530 [Gallionella sp.]|nr:hypothetical protein [Gallionella sp.]